MAKKPTFKGNTKNPNDKLSRNVVSKLLKDPRQEFWDDLPPKKHCTHEFRTAPGVREYLDSGKKFAKFAFNPNGSKVYLFYQM